MCFFVAIIHTPCRGSVLFRNGAWHIVLLHPENQLHWRVHNVWSCILGNEGSAWIHELITELLTTCICKHTTYKRKPMDSKIINITNCKPYNKRLLAAEYAILIVYYDQMAKTGELNGCTDEPTVQHADNPPNCDLLGDFHWTLPEFTVLVNWQSGYPSWKWLGSNPDCDPKQRSGPVSNTNNNWSCDWNDSGAKLLRGLLIEKRKPLFQFTGQVNKNLLTNWSKSQ